MAKFWTIKIDGFEMKIPAEAGATAKGDKGTPRNNDSYDTYCLRRSDARTELGAFKAIVGFLRGLLPVKFEEISPIETQLDVLEVFGGVGWHGCVIESLLRPTNHEVWDISLGCVQAVRASLPRVKACVRDSFESARLRVLGEYDWVHADFNRYTIMRNENDSMYHGVDMGIFLAAKRFVTITDSALYGVARFEQNREAYAKLFGVEVKDWESYCEGANQYYKQCYGWRIVATTSWCGMAGMYLLERGTGKKKIRHLGAGRPVTLELPSEMRGKRGGAA